MPSMPTKTLGLRRGADGYWRTSWTDAAGKVHRKSFGADKNKARNRFATFNARWMKNADVRQGTSSDALTLREAAAKLEVYAKGHYVRRDGSQTGEAQGVMAALAPALRLFGDAPLAEFDADALKRTRDEMIRLGWCVNTINARVRRIRSACGWFVGEKMMDATKWHEMRAVKALSSHRGVVIDGKPVRVRATKPVTTVPDAYILATIEHLPLTIATMVRVELLTGMRPTEVCLMRPMDIDTSGPVWLYRPQRHKTEHHGKERIVAIGPQAQAWLAPFMARPVHAYLFTPAEAMEQRLAKRREQYLPTPGKGDYRRWQSQTARERQPRGGNVFDRTTYGRAIARACDDANVPRWSPNRLRHNAGTNARRHFGLEGAQAVLGHAKANVTQVYAELGVETAAAAMLKIG